MNQRQREIIHFEAEPPQSFASWLDTLLATLPPPDEASEAVDVLVHPKGLLELLHLSLPVVEPKEHLNKDVCIRMQSSHSKDTRKVWLSEYALNYNDTLVMISEMFCDFWRIRLNVV